LEEKAIFFLQRDRISELEEAKANNLLPDRVTTLNIDKSTASYLLVYKLYEKEGYLYDQDGKKVGKNSKKLRTIKKVAKFKESFDFYQLDFK
jgi:hypothetical protein